MKIVMTKVSDMLLTLLTVAVKKYHSMVVFTMVATTMAAVTIVAVTMVVVIEDVLVVHWSARNMPVNIVKLVTMYNLLLRVKVKMSMCNLIG